MVSRNDLLHLWPALDDRERLDGFGMLTRVDAAELFDHLDPLDQVSLLEHLPVPERKQLLRYLDPDDIADLIQAAAPDERGGMLALLDSPSRQEVLALLAYEEDDAGGLMNPRYTRLRPDMTVSAAIAYLRHQAATRVEIIHYAYVLDAEQRLLGLVTLRQLVVAPPDVLIRDIMRTDLITVREETDQEEVSNLFAEHDLVVLPVIDADGRMKGIVTHDDVVDVVMEEATEDMHKLGGTEALDAPYLQISMVELLQKRVGWLVVLLMMGFGAVLTMQHFNHEMQLAGVLTVFVPLIISSGGNSGTQASTLVVRAMALGEVALGDWPRVIRRELTVGFSLGAALSIMGILGVMIWHLAALALLAGESPFGDHAVLLAITLAISILAVAAWGTLIGSTLPFVLRGLRFDPASASAPLVATIVDATGLVLYFKIAAYMLRGTLL